MQQRPLRAEVAALKAQLSARSASTGAADVKSAAPPPSPLPLTGVDQFPLWSDRQRPDFRLSGSDRVVPCGPLCLEA
jgi:hypothetical protein